MQGNENWVNVSVSGFNVSGFLSVSVRLMAKRSYEPYETEKDLGSLNSSKEEKQQVRKRHRISYKQFRSKQRETHEYSDIEIAY